MDEDGNLRSGCKIIKKGEVYETNFFQSKKEEFKSNAFLQNTKQIMTDAINEIVKDENEKLQVFQRGGPYLAAKKIGKNNPKEAEIRADNYLRHEWTWKVDRALLTGASEVEVMIAKQSQIDEPVAESLREHGHDPKLFTGILQKAIGYLREFVEFLREMKY
ncbi:MAG: MobA/MobL family protein, partial [Candidatus Limivivens sp.]|nr:MobA/MobL family protein [Candidatus Limivivens sp.]